MSSDIQSTLQFLVLNNHLALAGVTAVVYDYTLTFSRELDYIWHRPWTWVSTMFVVVRYLGLYWIVSTALFGSSFVPGPSEVSQFCDKRWISNGQIDTIITVVVDGVYDNPYTSVTTIRILDFSFCVAPYNNVNVSVSYYVAPRLVLGAILTILAVFQTLKQSFGMYKATKVWQPNRYMRKLVKDGILYFVMNVLYQTNDLLNITGLPLGNTAIFLQAFVSIAFYIAIPLFVISIRELYDRDIHRGFHIDTGFGVQSRSNAGTDATVSAIVFEDENRSGDPVTSADLEMGRRAHRSSSNEDPSIDRE
ncbi:hypothetical protein L210DRAFT_3765503 [Boletus edulis BED1]|uniref:DUF6533 domain-containing protein n=1 Tax=Boletus edulis BED1 TaxID=1328754 RepID=A0AAD4BF74_BOLED|nr:hypothetical protein L210DRAFT_3765503 [Boletus edulis BED1]